MEKNVQYTAQEGYTFKRKVDGFMMGNHLILGLYIDGTEDVIENYEEVKDPDYKPKKVRKTK